MTVPAALSRRPLVLVAVAIALGVLVGNVPLSTLLLSAAGLGILVAAIARRSIRLAICALVVGFLASGALRQQLHRSPGPMDISHHAPQSYVEVRGRAVSEPVRSGTQYRVTLWATHLALPGAAPVACTGLVQCTLPSGLPVDRNRTASSETARLLRYGDPITASGKLTRPDPDRNPGGPRYDEYLQRHGILTSLKVRYASRWRVIAGGREGVRDPVRTALSWRRAMHTMFASHLRTDAAALLTGIVLGGRQGLSDATSDAFTRAGAAHILAASGANVAILVFGLIGVSRILLVSRQTRAALAIAGTVAYAVAAGAEPAVTRAAIMAAVYLAAPVLDRIPDPPSAVAAAAIVTLVADPGYLLDAGFQLSFAIVALAIAVMPLHTRLLDCWLPTPDVRSSRTAAWANRRLRQAASIVLLSLTATIASVPLTVQTFNMVSLVAVPCNALLAPAIAFLLPAALLTWILGSLWPTTAAILCPTVLYWPAEYLIAVTHGLGRLPYATIHLPSPGWLVTIVAYALLALAAAAALHKWGPTSP